MIFKIRAAWKVENIKRVRTIACVRLREQDLNNDVGREFTSRNVSGNIVKFWVSHLRWDPSRRSRLILQVLCSVGPPSRARPPLAPGRLHHI